MKAKWSGRVICLLSLCALSVALMTGAASGAAVVITFDDLGLPPLGDVTNQYAGLGVIVQGFTDGGSQTNLEVAGDSVFSDINPTSLPYALSNFYDHDSSQRAHIIRLIFTTPANGITFKYNGAGSSGANTTFNVYNALGVLIDSFHVPSAVDSSFWPVTVPDVNVGRIDILNPQQGWGHYIDDLQFQSTPVCGGPITFDFLGLPALSDVTNQYAAQGAVFQGFTESGTQTNLEIADSSVYADNNPPSPSYSLSNFYGHDKTQRAHIMRILFSPPASSIAFKYNGAGPVGANGAGSQGSNTVFNAYSSAGVLLDSFRVPSAIDAAFHPVLVADLNVGYLDIVSPQPGWGHYIDDLQFHCAPPPNLTVQPAVALNWSSVMNEVYQLQWASTMDTNTWFNLGTPVLGNGGTMTTFDAVNAGSRFYRLVFGSLQPGPMLRAAVIASKKTNEAAGEEADRRYLIASPASATSEADKKTNSGESLQQR